MNYFKEIDIYMRGTSTPSLESFKNWLNSKYALELEAYELKDIWASYKTIFLGWN
jgi:hypothetical protein